MNNNDIYDELTPYEEHKENVFFDLSYNIIDECRNHSPWLLNTTVSNIELTDIFCNYIDFKNPFILTEDNLSSDSDDELSS